MTIEAPSNAVKLLNRIDTRFVDAMAYEAITVRMNRSNESISWGFTVGGGSGSPLRIASIEKDSLADKAGLETGDIITDLVGRNTKNMSLHDAKGLVERSVHEILMNLQRYYTSHPCLPWNLTERDNKIIVDRIQSSDSSIRHKTYQSDEINQFSSQTKSPNSIPVHIENYHSEQNKINRPNDLSYQNAPFTNVTNSAQHTGNHRSSGFQNSYTAESYTKKISNSDDERSERNRTHFMPTEYQSGINENSYRRHIQQQQQNQTGNGFRTTYMPIHIDTKASEPFDARSLHKSPDESHSQQSFASNARNNYRETGNVRFIHSPRTIRQLSPSASIRHLQYNSPMNLYSPESAAEQYLQQTGGLFGTDPNLRRHGDAPYLTSETRRLIAEEETGKDFRAHSPSAQSASFKRISRACGTPVD